MIHGSRYWRDSWRPSPPDLAELVRADGIEFVLAVFVDLTGKPCAKLVPAQAVEELRDAGGGVRR
ncbi:hypothetical protein ACRAWF_41175 [Streptomyces sp. L7]